jgi:hypothetical protein
MQISVKITRFRAQIDCVRTQWLDIHQKKGTFFTKTGCNPLRVAKIVVPLHRQKETMTTSIEITQTQYRGIS